MHSILKRSAALIASAATLLGGGMLVAGTADAAVMRDPFERSIQNGNPGLWANLGTITFSNGKQYENMAQSLGVVDRVNGKNTYCIEADTLYTGTTGTWGDWTDERTKTDAQRLAWLTDRHNGDRDDLTQAAIAGLIHQKLDPMGNEYLSGIERLGWKDGTSWDTYAAKMDSLWNEAVANTPKDLDMQYRYTTGKRKGLVTPSIMNGNGVEIAGIQYTVTLKGPAVFDQTGTNTISGTTTNEAIHLSWTATGNGKVTSIVQHKIPKATRLESPNQNLMGPTDPQTVSKNITFQVQANPASIRYRDDWGATGSTPDTTGVTGQDVTIARNGFTRPGYTFTGWARDRRTDPSLQPGGRYTLTPGTTTLWAQWKADPAHLIYNANTGSTSQTRRTDGVVDQTLTVIANPFTRTGYTFTGWNTQADGRGRAYTAGNGFRLVADAKSNPVNTSVLYAQWRINRVTLKFNPNGGTGGYPDITADAFTTVTIPADAKEPKVQRPGFRFTGWAMKPTPGNGDTILSPGKGTVSMPDRGSITVYAQWAPAMTTLPFTGGQAQVPTIWLYSGFALMLIALGVMMPMLRMRMAATKRTGKHMPITGGKHAK